MQGFDAKDVKFGAAHALALGRAADLAYRQGAAVRDGAAKWGLSAQFLSAKVGLADTQAFVAKDAEVVIVAFRGTETDQPKDFLTDAKFDEDPVRPAGVLQGRVHEGFQEALDAAWPAVEDSIRAARDGAQTLWITGHSLGAALATLAAARLAAGGASVNGLYTYGSPRVGDRAFAACFGKLLGARTFRFVNHRDIVPRVPPETLGELQYKHVGQVKYFDRDGNLSDGPSIWEEIKEAFQDLDWTKLVAGNPTRDDLLDALKAPLEDHAMARYLEKLVKLANG
jgi:triacylglycerol lipase